MDITEAKQRLELTLSMEEWNAVCAQIKEAYGGAFPDWWRQEIIDSRLIFRVQRNWSPVGSDEGAGAPKVGSPGMGRRTGDPDLGQWIFETLDILDWPTRLWARIRDKNPSTVRNWAKGKRMPPPEETSWLDSVREFVTNAPDLLLAEDSLPEESRLSRGAFVRIVWTLGWDPIGFDAAGSAGAVWGVDPQVIRDIACGRSPVPCRLGRELWRLWAELPDETREVPFPDFWQRLLHIQDKAEITLEAISRCWDLGTNDAMRILQVPEIAPWMELVLAFVSEGKSLFSGPESNMRADRFREIVELLGWSVTDAGESPSLVRLLGSDQVTKMASGEIPVPNRMALSLRGIMRPIEAFRVKKKQVLREQREEVPQPENVEGGTT